MAHVLVIEDNPTNLDLMVYLLQAFGHTALAAHDGEHGLEILRQESPELILCDVQMPRLDGFGVARRLKNNPVWSRIPLVAVTALAMVGDRDKLLAAGFDGYIAKPIDPESFMEQVEAFLSNGPRPAPQPAPASTGADGRPATILVVDNSPINLDLARSRLEPFGYNVITAGSVREALEVLQHTSPDLILSDVHMPGKSGFELIKEVKADSHLRTIPFTFISSTVWRESDREQGLALGANAFILRPVEPDVLVARIEACLRPGKKTGGG